MAKEGHVNAANPAVLAALQPPPGRHVHQIYIVQLPKNQVYRVPPRENALIVEQFRNPANAKKRRGGCSCCCERRVLITLGLIVASVVAIVGITLATLYLIFNPRGPKFSVSNLVVQSGGGNNNSQPQYKVWLRANNPNERLGFEYKEGAVSLFIEGTKVAAGRFPLLHQGQEDSSVVIVAMSGPGRVFHRLRNGGDAPVTLKLEMNLAVRIRTAGMETWLMKSNVACEFEVRSLRKDTRVLSQQCYTLFRQY